MMKGIDTKNTVIRSKMMFYELRYYVLYIILSRVFTVYERFCSWYRVVNLV